MLHEIIDIVDKKNAIQLLSEQFLANKFINSVLGKSINKKIYNYFEVMFLILENLEIKGIYDNNKLTSVIVYETPENKMKISLKDILLIHKYLGHFNAFRFIYYLTKAYSKFPRSDYYIIYVATHDLYKNIGLASELINYVKSKSGYKVLDIQGNDLQKYYEKFGFKIIKINHIRNKFDNIIMGVK